jgi:hypothetical protein
MQKLTGSDPNPDDQFGYSVAITRNDLLVAALHEDHPVSPDDAGAIYAFEKTSGLWGQTDKLYASDAGFGDGFGGVMAIAGNQAIAAAVGNDDAGSSSGSAYIFEKAGGAWSETKKLTASDADAGDQFGQSVGITADRAVVGAPRNDDAGESSGSAYVFEKTGGIWSEAKKLTPSDPDSYDWFGDSVAIAGDYLVVASPLDDDLWDNEGAVYVFERIGGVWTQIDKITTSDGELDDRFGEAVAISGTRIAVGAVGDDDAGSNAGAVYVFDKSGSTWSEVAKVTASDAASSEEFGTKVALNGDVVVVGVAKHDHGTYDSGSAYVYAKTPRGWEEVGELRHEAPFILDQFGHSVAISDVEIVAGAIGDDDVWAASGSVTVFHRTYLELFLGSTAPGPAAGLYPDMLVGDGR